MTGGCPFESLDAVQPRCTSALLNFIASSEIPHFIPDQSDTTGRIFFHSRMIPTPPDQSDHMHPSFNPKVPGSRPGRPTRPTISR
jgi:hypothetical protein